MNDFVILRDSREKPGQGWTWAAHGECKGTIVAKLETADYAIQGREKECVVERKKSPAELIGCLYKPRFVAELVRMKDITFSFVVLEFHVEDLLKWPHNSGLSAQQKAKVRVSGRSALRRVLELQISYPWVRWQFVGANGKEFVASLFRRILERDLPAPEAVES